MNKRARNILLISLLAFIMVFTAACSGGNVNKDPKVADNVVAVVNDQNIYVEDFTKNFKIVEKQYNTQYPQDIWSKEVQSGKTFLEVIQEKILNDLVMQEVLLQDAAKKSIKADEKNVEDAYNVYKTQTDSDEEIKKFYEENGIDEAFVKKQARTRDILNKYQETVINELKLNDDKNVEDMTKDYVYEVKAQHILIMPDEAEKNKEKADADAKKKTEEILAKIKAGEDFGKLAKENSQDPGSAVQNGDLGYFGRGRMVPEFEEASFALGVGEVSNLVKTDYGYHIIKVNDKKTLEKAKSEMTDEEYAKIKNSVELEVKNKALNDYYDNLMDNAKIYKYIEHVK